MTHSDNHPSIISHVKEMLLAALSAIMLASAFPEFSFAFIAWLALTPMIVLIYRCGFLKGIFYSWCTGFLFYCCLLGWTLRLGKMNIYSFLLFGLYLASYFGMFAAIAKYFHKRFPRCDALIFPCIWVILEYLKANSGFLSFPLGILGYSQYKILPISGIAEFTGVYGVSFAIVAVNTVIALIIRHYIGLNYEGSHDNNIRQPAGFPLLQTAGIILILTSFFLPGISRSQSEKIGKSLDVAIIQGNAAADEKTGYANYLRDVLPIYEKYTDNAAAAGSSLVVWPSSSVPGVLPMDRMMVVRVGEIAKKNKVHLLIGAAGADKFNAEQVRTKKVATSAFLFSPGGSILNRYDKMRLLPFDEYFPARDYISWPSWIGDPSKKDYYPGKKLTMFNAGDARFGVQICFENMFPDQIRKLVGNGADFIISQNNDIWTNSSAAQYQLLAYSVFRAIENRVPVIRSSANGVSCVINSSGRIVASVKDSAGKENNIAGFSIAKVSVGSHRSFYNRFGDLFCHINIFCVLLLGLFGFFKKACTLIHSLNS